MEMREAPGSPTTCRNAPCSAGALMGSEPRDGDAAAVYAERHNLCFLLRRAAALRGTRVPEASAPPTLAPRSGNFFQLAGFSTTYIEAASGSLAPTVPTSPPMEIGFPGHHPGMVWHFTHGIGGHDPGNGLRIGYTPAREYPDRSIRKNFDGQSGGSCAPEFTLGHALGSHR